MKIAQNAEIQWGNREEELDEEGIFNYWEDDLYRAYQKEADAANSLAIQWKGIENANQG
jgi:hypothetical protein